MKIRSKALTFADLLLVPKYSSIIPNEVIVKTKLTKNIYMNIPIISAAMDRVTEYKTAIAMARLGGIGIIHKNMNIKAQVKQITRVKKSENGIIFEPISISPEKRVDEAIYLMKKYSISGILVVDKNKKLIGIVTNRDIRFIENLSIKIESIMTKIPLITANYNISLDEAALILQKNKIEKLPIIDSDDILQGLITIKDIQNITKYPNSIKDLNGSLIVGAAVGVNELKRVEALVNAGVDVIVVDSAHGHSKGVIDTVKAIKKSFNVDVIAGNIVTKEGAKDLIEAGADALKVGIGPGSICTTRIVAGVGMPQVFAIDEVANMAKKYNIPVIADGGIKYSGDLAKALAVGASSIMLGSMLAGTYESPGDTILLNGRQFKEYRGMESIGAMEDGSKDRYFQKEVLKDKLVPEGIEGRVPYRGNISSVIYQMIGGLKSSMGYCGSKDIKTFWEKAEFVEITSSGLQESHIHDVIVTKESPNYNY